MRNLRDEIVRNYVERLDPNTLCLTEPVKVSTVSQLNLGEANLNFLVEANGKKFVFRINMDPSSEGRSRKEFSILKLLAGYQVSPRAFYLDETKKAINETLLIIEYVDGETLAEEGTRYVSPNKVQGLAELIATIHSLDLGESMRSLQRRGVDYEDWVSVNERNINYVRKRNPEVLKKGSLAEALHDGLSRIRSIMRATSCSVITTPAHGDVCAQNIIVERGTGNLRLIDWENFGLWDPAAEIALIFEGFGMDFPPDQQQEFLDRYLGIRSDPELLTRLDTYRPLVRLEQLTWGIKHVIEIRAGDMDEAFIERTNMRRHIEFVGDCLQRCMETRLIDIDPKRIEEFMMSLSTSE
jgi:aminoglycoside phosphotransferase (APT) family kinase protein